MKGEGRKSKRRSYLPAVEALEALRLLSGSAAPALPGIVVEHEHLGGPIAPDDRAVSDDAWDAALGQTRLVDLLAPTRGEADPRTVQSGLSQLDRYLSRAWYRAGIPPSSTTTARRRST